MTLRIALPSLGLALALVASGCVTSQPWLGNQEPAPAVCQVHGIWEGHIRVTQDVVNGGRPLPGLAGRLYLFGPEFGKPEKGDGKVAVDLYDISDTRPGAKAKHIQRWEFDATTLNRLLRKDKIGWGYTLFLPWPDYTQDITRVQLNVCYTPVTGAPLYAEPITTSLRNEATLTQTRQISGQNVPAVAKQ